MELEKLLVYGKITALFTNSYVCQASKINFEKLIG